MDQVIIRKIDLPVGVNGITILDSEGDYNIYLNSRLSYDYNKTTEANIIEYDRHQG